MLDTLVIGGGFSGLAVAWHLNRCGVPVALWEAGSRVGGWVETRSWPTLDGGEGHIEVGPQGLRCASHSALARLLEEAGVACEREAPRGPRLLLDRDGLHPLPRTFAGWLRSPLLGWAGSLRLLREPFQGRTPGALPSLQAVALHRFGSTFADRFWPAIIQGLLGAAPEGLDRSALPTLDRMDQRGGLLRQALAEGTPRRLRPIGGMGRIPEALARPLDLTLERKAVALLRTPEGWAVQDATGQECQARRVVLALPAGAAARLLAPHAPPLAEHLARLPQTSLHTQHSRHAPMPGWERGLTLLAHPRAASPLLGLTSLPFQGQAPLQIRSIGRYADLGPLPLPDLGPAQQSLALDLPEALPAPPPGWGAAVDAMLRQLPPDLCTVGAWRWGPGLGDLAEGARQWAEALGLHPGRT